MEEEMVDIVDKNDKVIDTVPRSQMRKKNLRHRTTYFMIFNSKGEILITKRTKTKDIDPGLYEIPGGTISAGETYEESAYREIKEELGIKNIKLKTLFDFSYEDEKRKEISRVYTLVYDREIKPQKEEIESYFFISLDKLMKMIKKDKEKFCKNRIEIIEKYLALEK